MIKNLIKEKVISLYKTGMGATKISRIVNLPLSTTSKILKENIIIRPLKESMRKYYINHDYFEKINTEDKAYWLGFILADGCIVNNKTIRINLAKIDKEHLSLFLKYAESNYKIFFYKEYCCITITSEKMVNDLKKLGITKNKSLIVTLPCIDNYLINHLWRGIFDGDGCINYRSKGIQKGQLRINLVGSYSIINSFKNFVKTNSNCKANIQNKGNFARFEVSGNNAYKILEIIKSSSDCFLKRKWIKEGYGMVMDRIPFTTKEIDSQKKST